jgi:hypothetical protein
MNKQPFYHRAVILFTGLGKEYSRDEVTKVMRGKGDRTHILITSIECEEVDAEPGDPQDLM